MERVSCLVPGCRSSRGPRKGDDFPWPPGPWFQWLCSRHYTSTDLMLRKRRTQAKRQKRWELDDLIWRKLVRQAIERAMGIG